MATVEPSCTGQTAYWCPRCGDCTCERAVNGDCSFDDERCPLHAVTSKHAETIELAEAERRVRDLADDLGAELTPNDERELSRFVQFLMGKSRRVHVDSFE
jgi:hypothetical protein